MCRHDKVSAHEQACEMFILELTLRSWNHSEENKRRTLQRNDIAAAITRTDIFDFLVRRLSSVVLKKCKNILLFMLSFAFGVSFAVNEWAGGGTGGHSA